MNPLLTSFLALVCTFGGVLAGMRIRSSLPAHHLASDSRDTVMLGIGLIATMTALVLGLVTASAKGSFDLVDTTIKESAAEILALDRTLAQYGPETAPLRADLKRNLAARIDTVWPPDRLLGARFDLSGATPDVEQLSAQIRRLTPQNDEQRFLKSHALALSDSVVEARWLVSAGRGSSVPTLFLVILLFWLTITFVSFGIFAPRNATVVAVLFLCTFSVAGAIFLILEMDGAFEGVLVVSGDPLRYALSHLSQ
ncbi:MAG TPA: hypothetical protein VII78_02140 [Myxococcota bacterium]|jgi:hypothetical protein